MYATPPSTEKRRTLSNRKRELLRTFQRLLNHFGPRHWWPAEHAWEMMVGAILTQNTSWQNVEKALDGLRKARALSVEQIAKLPRPKLETLIQPSGFFRQKSERLQAFARYLQHHPNFHNKLLGRSRVESLSELRHELLSLGGIGPETADSILLYAGAYPIFVVDAYTRRIGQRMGWFRSDDYHEVQAFFQDALPPDAPLYNEFHALLVELAKSYCKSRVTFCSLCPLQPDCVFGRRRRRDAEEIKKR